MNVRSLLLVPPTPQGISLPGLVAASARLNVLGDVKSTLRSIGLSPIRPGCISVAVAGREDALAARLGCPVSVVEAAATPSLDPTDGSIVRWGDGAIRRVYLVTRTRRISTAAMAISPHHRAAWSNALLDYCPESLELLIDRCARCGRSQRWLAAEGIDVCDEPGCGPLPGSGEDLPNVLVEGYRRFAGICSPVPAERQATLAGLTPELTALHPVSLTDFALKIGLALENTASARHSGFGDLTPIQRSRAASRGAMALGEWPHRIRSEIQTELADRGIGDGTARRELRAGLLAAGRSIRGGSDLTGLMSKALPEIYVEVGRSFGGLHGPRVLGSVAARSLGISHARLRQMSQAGLFREEGVVDGGYRRALYDADRIEAAAEAWRRSSPIEGLMRRLGLPRYACERIVGAGDVEGEAHPFALALEGQPRFRSGALDDYVTAIRTVCRHGPAPADAVRFEAAMKAVGGRLKPWRQVLDAVRRGALPAWHVEGEGPLVARLYVRPDEVEHFCRLDANDGVKPEAFLSDRQSQIDAVAVLNLRQIDGPLLAAARVLRFERGSKSLLVPIDDVLAVARGHVATAEAAARLRQPPGVAWRRVERDLGPPSSAAGWRRRSFDEWFFGQMGASSDAESHGQGRHRVDGSGVGEARSQNGSIPAT